MEQTQLNILIQMSIEEKFLLVLKRSYFIYEYFREKAFETKKLLRKKDNEAIQWDPPGLLGLLKTIKNVDSDLNDLYSSNDEIVTDDELE